MDNQSKYKSKLGLVISLITISFVALNYVFYPNLIFAQLFTIAYLILIYFCFNGGDIKKYMYYVTLLFSIINFSLTLPISSKKSLYYYYITLFIYFVIDISDKIKTKQHIKFNFKKAFKSKYYNFFIIFIAYVVFSIILTVDKKLGLRTVFNYFIMFFYTAMIIKENKNLKDVKGTFNFFKLLYIGILFFGTLEVFGIRFGIRNHFVELGFSLKEYPYLNKIPVSFFFNPNNYAVVLVIGMIITAISYCYSNNKNEKRMLIIIYVASQINLIFTTSRTCWITIFIALFLCYIISLIKKEKKLQKTALSYILLTFLIFTVLSPIPYFEPYYGKFNTTPILNKLNIVHMVKNPDAPEAKKIKLGGEGSNNERFTLIYDVFHGVFTEKHFLGFGAGNISCYIKSMNNTFGVLNIHSLWFEILGDFGVGIFVYYVLTYSLLLLDLFKSWRKKEQGDIKNYTLMTLVCLFAFVFLVFAPSTVVAYVPYWTVIGISFALVLNKKSIEGE